MSYRQGNTFIIQETAPAKCDLCGAHAELRPYGPNREKVCFDCAMRNPEATKAAIDAAMDGCAVALVLHGKPQ